MQPSDQPLDIDALTRALCAPFAPGEVKFKPSAVSGNRALALAYVDARVIQDRLDEVLGVMGWQDSYRILPDGSVMCRLRIRLGNQWITKVDVGSQSEQPDCGDRTKAAFSDALKRAAVKFGIGRYLYRLPSMWVDYDPQKKRFAREPQLPPSALPPRPASAQRPAAMTGPELQRRLQAHDARLASEGLSKDGELLNHVLQAGLKAGYGPDLSAWSGQAIDLAIAETKRFQRDCRSEPVG